MYTGFGSIVTAAVTPFDSAGQVNLDAFRALLRHLAGSGSDAVVVTGTTGESPTLRDQEKLDLWRTAVEELGGTIPVIAGAGTNDTAHSEELVRAACELGVDGILAVTPYYNKPPREGLVRHFGRIARASSVPVIVYNIPGRVVVNLEPDLVAELATLDNVVAVKQANPDVAQASEIASLAPDLAIYAGDDTSLLPMLPVGAIGVISVASHVVGREMGRVVELFRSGDEAGARDLSATLEDVYETLMLTSNPIPVKAAMQLMGFDVGDPRLPLVPATGLQREKVRAMLDRHGVAAAHA
jgi:4-hydroxy-tetrahydrodipicolinate synthase